MYIQYFYTRDHLGPNDGVDITYITRYKTVEEAYEDVDNSNSKMISESEAHKLIEGEEWEHSPGGYSYIVLSKVVN